MSVAKTRIQELMERCKKALPFERLTSTDGGPFLRLHAPEEPQREVGFVDVLVGDGRHAIDRVLHIWLSAPGARMDTNLLWLFAAEDSATPHFHAQLIHAPGDRYIYNFDLMPRVDLAVHPEYVREVFAPLDEAHGAFVRDNARKETRLPMPPTTAVFLSPWGLAALGAPASELALAWPLCAAYLDRSLAAARELRFVTEDRESLRRRHRALVAGHTSEEVDPRGWRGIARMAGQTACEQIKQLMREPLAS